MNKVVVAEKDTLLKTSDVRATTNPVWLAGPQSGYLSQIQEFENLGQLLENPTLMILLLDLASVLPQELLTWTLWSTSHCNWL